MASSTSQAPCPSSRTRWTLPAMDACGKLPSPMTIRSPWPISIRIFKSSGESRLGMPFSTRNPSCAQFGSDFVPQFRPAADIPVGDLLDVLPLAARGAVLDGDHLTAGGLRGFHCIQRVLKVHAALRRRAEPLCDEIKVRRFGLGDGLLIVV